MDGGSSSSASSRRKGKARLPSITCPECKRDGSGCSFWFWEEEYEQYLRKKGYLPSLSESRQPQSQPVVHVQSDREVAGEDNDRKQAKKMKLAEIGREIIMLLKLILAACICIVATNLYAMISKG